MKRSYPYVLILVVLAMLLAACGGDDPTPTPVPAATAVPVEPVATEAPVATEPPAVVVAPTAIPVPTSPLDSMEHVPDPSLVNITWEWQRRDPNANESPNIEVPNPENYTLFFNEDGTFDAKLDCNNGSGSYKTPMPGEIYMELGPTTLAACPDGSLAGEMTSIFGGAVQSYRFEEDGNVLVMMWAAGGPLDYYRNAAAVEEPQLIPPGAIQMDTGDLAESFSWEVVPASAIAQGPGGQGFPAHIVLTFDGESAESAVANQSQRMYIFPTQAYIDLYAASGSTIVADQVSRLEQLIASAPGRTELPESPMPLLPPPASYMDRWVQFADLNFGVGSGVRYVSDSPLRQALGPWTNETTGYYYEGLTTDRNFYVSLYWPESTAQLPNTEADVPPDVMAAATNPDTSAEYQQQVQDTLNALPSNEWAPDLAALDAMVASLTFPTEPEPTLTGITWNWYALTNAAGVTPVEGLSRYTVLFNDDGSANIKADCNQVVATYATEGESITLTLGPTTLAACPLDSLDQQFLQGLEAAEAFGFQNGDLILALGLDAGFMSFTEEEVVNLPAPDAGEATGTVIAPDGIYLRSGPGAEYPPVGTVPFGTTGTIIGVSVDGAWWVVEAPNQEGGQAWVSATYVEAVNAEGVPVVPAPPLPAPPDPLVGALWEWVSTTTPVEQVVVNDPTRYSILFNADGTASIKADCNQVGGSYQTDGSTINIVLGPTTLAACPEDTQDQLYLTSLESAASYFFQDGQLYMDMFADSGTMRFAPAGTVAAPPTDTEPPAGDPETIQFTLTSFGAVGAEQPVLPGTTITALFTPDSVSGSAGCNSYSGARTPVDDYFVIGPVAATQSNCTEPAGIMEQETAYLAGLATVNGYEWVYQDVGGQQVVSAGQLFYTLPDGTPGVMNFVTS